MLKAISLFLALFFSILLNAQTPDSAAEKSRYIKSIKINFGYKHYNDFDFIKLSDQGFYPYPNSYFGNSAVSLQLKSRKTFNTHEFEIGGFAFNKSFYKNDSSSQRGNNERIALRYEFNYFFLKNPSRFSPYMGADIMLFMDRGKQSNKLSSYHYSSYYYTSYYTSIQKQFAVQMSFVPGIQFAITNRIFFDLGIPLTICRISRFQYKELPEYNYNYNDAFPAFKRKYLQARLGMGIILGDPSGKELKPEKYSKTLKLNSNSDVEFRKGHGPFSGTRGFAPVLTWQNKLNFNMHEIELSQLLYNSTHYLSPTSQHNTYFTLRYQFNYFFIQREKKMFSPYIGTSLWLSYNKSREVYKNLQDHNQGSLTLSSEVSIVPGIQFYPSSRIYLDLSSPTRVITDFISTTKKQNRDYGYYYKFFPDLSYRTLNFRLGIGYRI